MPRRHLILALLAWLAIGVLPTALGRTPFSAGLWGGWLVAGLAGAVTFAFLGWAADRPLTQTLRAMALGFLIRFVLLAFGLVLTARAGGTPLGYCVGFFAVYLPLQGIEIAALLARQRFAEARP